MPGTTEKVIVVGLCGKKRAGKDTIGNHLVKKYGFYRLAFADPLKKACQEIFGLSGDQTWGDGKDSIDEYWQHSPRELFQAVGTELLRRQLPNHCPNITDKIWIKSIDRKIQELVKQGINRIVITDVRFLDEFEFVKRQSALQIDVAASKKALTKEQSTFYLKLDTKRRCVKSGIIDLKRPLQQPTRSGYTIKVHRTSALPTENTSASPTEHTSSSHTENTSASPTENTSASLTRSSTNTHVSEVECELFKCDFELMNDNSIESIHAKVDALCRNIL